MSKHKHPKDAGSAASARARLAAAQAARERRRRRLILVIVPLAVIVVAVAVLVVAKVAGVGRATDTTATGTTGIADPGVIHHMTSVPASTLDKVGAGSVNAVPKAINGPSLTVNGKPTVLYIGAEYCPFCAAERWGMTVALSRFGTFQGLGQTASSNEAGEVYPNTASLTFHGSTLTSSTISFRGVETQGRAGHALDTPTAEEQQILATYDAPPYVPKSDAGSIPFVYIGGKYMINGASYSPQALQGKTHTEIAGALADPDSAIAQGVDGTANVITAAICATTNNTPANVCNSAGVRAAAQRLS